MRKRSCFLSTDSLSLGLLMGSQTTADGRQARTAEGAQQSDQAAHELDAQRKDSGKSFKLDQILNKGINAYDASDYSKALIEYDEGLELATRDSNRKMMGRFLKNMGQVYQSLGQYEKALDYSAQALALHRETNDRRSEGHTLANIGGVYKYLGQYEKALKYFQQALLIHKEDKVLTDRMDEAANHCNIGQIYYYLGEYDKSLEYYQQAVPIFSGREFGPFKYSDIALSKGVCVTPFVADHQRREGSALNDIGLIFQKLGQHEKALRYHRTALSTHRAVGYRLGVAYGLINIGHAYRSLGQFEKARQSLGEALEISLEMGAPDPLWGAQCALGEVESKQGEYAAAISHYDQAWGP